MRSLSCGQSCTVFKLVLVLRGSSTTMNPRRIRRKKFGLPIMFATLTARRTCSTRAFRALLRLVWCQQRLLVFAPLGGSGIPSHACGYAVTISLERFPSRDISHSSYVSRIFPDWRSCGLYCPKQNLDDAKSEKVKSRKSNDESWNLWTIDVWIWQSRCGFFLSSFFFFKLEPPLRRGDRFCFLHLGLPVSCRSYRTPELCLNKLMRENWYRSV